MVLYFVAIVTAFPRMDSEGKTTLSIATHTVEGTGDDKPMTLGQYVGKLSHGTGTLHCEYMYISGVTHFLN